MTSEYKRHGVDVLIIYKHYNAYNTCRRRQLYKPGVYSSASGWRARCQPLAIHDYYQPLGILYSPCPETWYFSHINSLGYTVYMCIYKEHISELHRSTRFLVRVRLPSIVSSYAIKVLSRLEPPWREQLIPKGKRHVTHRVHQLKAQEWRSRSRDRPTCVNEVKRTCSTLQLTVLWLFFFCWWGLVEPRASAQISSPHPLYEGNLCPFLLFLLRSLVQCYLSSSVWLNTKPSNLQFWTQPNYNVWSI